MNTRLRQISTNFVQLAPVDRHGHDSLIYVDMHETLGSVDYTMRDHTELQCIVVDENLVSDRDVGVSGIRDTCATRSSQFCLSHYVCHIFFGIL